MNHFYQDNNQNWWFKVNSDGRIREIAVSDDMLNALKRYRLSIGLTALPLSEDRTPLLIKKRDEKAITSAFQIHTLVQPCFDQAIRLLLKDKFIHEAKDMKNATVTWIRNTGISDDINKRGRPIEHVRDDAGHTANAITKQYIDIKTKESYKII